MPGKASPGTTRVVIVIPPTDHYRTYVIEGEVQKCTSRPLRPVNSGNSTPCGPKCPATKYQQLPWDSGIVQHFPEPAPQKPANNETEPQEQQVDRSIGNVENSRQECNASVKRPATETLTSKEPKRGRSSVTSPNVPQKTVPTRPTARKAPKAIYHKNSIILDCYVVLEPLDLPPNCKTVRLVRIDRRVKEELDARLVVQTSNGERLVTPVEGSPIKCSRQSAQSPGQRSRRENETGKKISTSKPSSIPGSAESKKRPLRTDFNETEASTSKTDSDPSDRSGAASSKDQNFVQKRAVLSPKDDLDAKASAVTSSRASAIRRSLAIAMPKGILKRWNSKKVVPSNTNSPSGTREDDELVSSTDRSSESTSNDSEPRSSASSVKTSEEQLPSSSDLNEPSTSSGQGTVKGDTVTRQSGNDLSSGRVPLDGREPDFVGVESLVARTSKRVANRPSHLEDFFTV